MLLDDIGHQGNSLRRGNVGQSYQPRVRRIVNENELGEVRIERHDYSVFGGRMLKQCQVARILSQFAGLDDIMPFDA